MAEAVEESLKEEQPVEQYRSPLGVTADEEGEDIVRVCVIIPGLKKKTFNNKEADNAEIDLKIEERSLCLIVRMKVKDKNNKSKTENYKYEVKQLPDTIIKEEKNFKVDNIKGKVVIWLKKKYPVSWARHMAQGCFRVVDIESSSSEESSSNSN